MPNCTVTVHYSEEIIPPRCRKPRLVDQKAIIDLPVNACTSEEAPVALVVRKKQIGEKHDVYTFRYWGGQLYLRKPRNHAGDSVNDYAKWDPTPTRRLYGELSRDQVTAQLKREYADILLIDGDQWWEQSGIPYFRLEPSKSFGSHYLWIEFHVPHGEHPLRAREYNIDNIAGALEDARKLGNLLREKPQAPSCSVQVLIPAAIKREPFAYRSPKELPCLRDRVLEQIRKLPETAYSSDIEQVVKDCESSQREWLDTHTLEGYFGALHS